MYKCIIIKNYLRKNNFIPKRTKDYLIEIFCMFCVQKPIISYEEKKSNYYQKKSYNEKKLKKIAKYYN